MGKIRVRKKLRKKIKDNSTLISYGLIALSVLFIFFMFLQSHKFSIFCNQYEINDR